MERKTRTQGVVTGAFRPASVLFGVLLCAAGAWATGTAVPHGTVELIAEKQWIVRGQSIDVGLRFQLEKGWHIYWVNPGDSGEPPSVKWELPAGLTTGAMEWPTPQRIGSSNIVDYGYQNDVMLIVPIHADASVTAQPAARVAADVKILVCREMCIPGSAQVSLTLPIKSQPPASNAGSIEVFAATRRSMPRPMPVNWKIRAAEENDSFVLTATTGRPITQAMFFPLAESQIENATPQMLVPEATGFKLLLRKSNQLLKPIERMRGVLVVPRAQSYLIDVPVTPLAATQKSSGVETTRSNR
jgi:thiol:disulfide interchange protein DsbD